MVSTEIPVLTKTPEEWVQFTAEKKAREAEDLEKEMEIRNGLLEEYCVSLKDKVRNNKILFVKPIHLDIETFEPAVAKNRSYYAYPPTGLQYLEDSIEGRGLESKVIDLNFELLERVVKDETYDYKNWLNILDEEIKRFDPSIIGVSNHFTIDYDTFTETLDFLKDRNHIVISGGQNATYEFEKILNLGQSQFVIQREGENKLNYLLDFFYPSTNTKPTPSIMFKYRGSNKEYDNKIVESAGELDIVGLRGNIIGSHKKIPIERYSSVGSLSPYSRMAGTPFATVQFNRGCQAQCRFCGVSDFMGVGVRSRPKNDLLDEVQYLYDKGIRHFEILDDDFFRNREEAKEILQDIKDKNLTGMTWASNNGIIARTVDSEALQLMVDTGCLGFKIGVETGNAVRLREVRKPGTIPEFLQFSERVNKFPQLFMADNYIIGLPNETFAEIIESYNFAQLMKLDWSQNAVYQENVACFGYKKEIQKKKDNTIGDFIPSKDHYMAMIGTGGEVLQGLDIFKYLPRDQLPSHNQKQMIWIMSDFGRNFVHNKNLTSEGNPEKFLSWVDMVQLRYPTHPYINMFVSHARRLLGDNKEADKQHNLMVENLAEEEHRDYWKHRFDVQGLTDIAENMPKTISETENALQILRERYTVKTEINRTYELSEKVLGSNGEINDARNRLYNDRVVTTRNIMSRLGNKIDRGISLAYIDKEKVPQPFQNNKHTINEEVNYKQHMSRIELVNVGGVLRDASKSLDDGSRFNLHIINRDNEVIGHINYNPTERENGNLKSDINLQIYGNAVNDRKYGELLRSI